MYVSQLSSVGGALHIYNVASLWYYDVRTYDDKPRDSVCEYKRLLVASQVCVCVCSVLSYKMFICDLFAPAKVSTYVYYCCSVQRTHTAYIHCDLDQGNSTVVVVALFQHHHHTARARPRDSTTAERKAQLAVFLIRGQAVPGSLVWTSSPQLQSGTESEKSLQELN